MLGTSRHDVPMTPPESARPGPRRPLGAPVGPEEVRAAVVEAAATLFAHKGVDAVSLRDIAQRADVNLALIRRYVGSRDQVIEAAFEYASDRLARAIAEHPLEGQGHAADTEMGMWLRIAASLSLAGRPLPTGGGVNPVRAMAQTLAAGYGVPEETARVRAAQIVATALGWRVFEDYLIEAGGLGDVGVDRLREELVHSARRLGATPWPSPPDPRPLDAG